MKVARQLTDMLPLLYYIITSICTGHFFVTYIHNRGKKMDTPFLFYNFTDAVVKSNFCSPMPEEDDDDELFAELCRRLRLTSIFFDL